MPVKFGARFFSEDGVIPTKLSLRANASVCALNSKHTVYLRSYRPFRGFLQKSQDISLTSEMGLSLLAT